MPMASRSCIPRIGSWSVNPSITSTTMGTARTMKGGRQPT